MGRMLVTGACGQIGTELVQALRERYGSDSVVATGHVTKPTRKLRGSGPFRYLNVSDMEQIAEIIMNYDIDVIYHLASILSAVGERNPQLCYDVNANGTYNVLEAARRHRVRSVIYTSSIAVFGHGAPKYNTPNEAVMLPSTMYGVTKVLGELLGTYYHSKFGLDFRCIRFPGIISSETLPGGGTTDYAVEMYYAAVEEKPYKCFVSRETVLPMMYMPDAINALITLAEADPSRLKRRVFNVQSMSFSAGELEESIKRVIPSFTCEYEPDYRQAIADSWPKTLDDSAAREEWGWKPLYSLQRMTEDMIEKLRRKLKEKNE
ncbi:MAG: NAD-dependent epimerase/dehydratase family protein [Candidatus Bathyarchaeia archaeon]